jgi:aminoglycoside phosphotransferase (APT) family kinase protein
VVESGVLVQVFPHDHRLPTLARCLDAARLDPVLVSAPCRRCAPVGYRPGMRCQIRYELADGTVVFGKVVVEGEPARAAARHARIFAVVNARPRGFAIARPLGYSTEARLSLVAAAAGRSLYAAVRAGEDLRAAMPCVARAVSEFHGVDMADVERAYGPSDELHLLEGWVALVADLYPALAGDLERGLEGLRATQPAPAPPRAFVHRDFYDKQVLLHGAAVTLLDMDTACAGDPEIDFGNFAAHLRLRGLQWGRAPACRDLEVEFLAACPGSIDPVRLDWYRRATLLRLACGYAVRPHWHHLAPALRAEMERP